ncbi:MAG: MerR family transcriptional regulator [Proteobacteria bacterium]|nr:MerR family transcriptional regulator [Pseudomonadota bacterium]
MKKISNKNRGFSVNDVCELVDVSARQLRYWDKENLVKPTATKVRKPGQFRRYSLQDIICVLVIKSLREKGISIQLIKEGVRRIEESLDIKHPLSKLRVACLSHSIYFKSDGKYIDPITGQMAIEQALEKIRPKIAKRKFIPGKRAIENVSKQYDKQIATL